MPKEVLRQRAWNAGEVDADLLGRDDVKTYFNAAQRVENLITVPQGPLTRRPGQPYVDTVRHLLEAVSLEDAALTAPEGGTAEDAAAVGGDSLLTATDLADTDGYVILAVDFGEPVRVDLVDLVDYALDDGVTAATPPPIHYPWGGGGFWWGVINQVLP